MNLFEQTPKDRRRYGLAAFIGLIAGIVSTFVKWGAEVPLPPRSPADIFRGFAPISSKSPKFARNPVILRSSEEKCFIDKSFISLLSSILIPLKSYVLSNLSGFLSGYNFFPPSADLQFFGVIFC